MWRHICWSLAWPRLIAQRGYTVCRKPLAPQTDRVWPYLKLVRHRIVPLTIQTTQNDLGTLDEASLFATAASKVHQFNSLPRQFWRWDCHSTGNR
jgi:hypothetical protein